MDETIGEWIDNLQHLVNNTERYINVLVNLLPTELLKKKAQDKIYIWTKEGSMHAGCSETFHHDIEWELRPYTSMDCSNFRCSFIFKYDIIYGRKNTDQKKNTNQFRRNDTSLQQQRFL